MFQTIVEPVDELDCLGGGGGMHNFVGRSAFIAVPDIALDRSGKEHGLLRNEADAAAQVGDLLLAHIDTVDERGTLR